MNYAFLCSGSNNNKIARSLSTIYYEELSKAVLDHKCFPQKQFSWRLYRIKRSIGELVTRTLLIYIQLSANYDNMAHNNQTSKISVICGHNI